MPADRYASLSLPLGACALVAATCFVVASVGGCSSSEEKTSSSGDELTNVAVAADATVRSGDFAWTNYGGARTVTLDQDADGTIRQGYVRFPASSFTGTLKRAYVRLFVTDGSDDSADVFSISNTTWSESRITWNRRPAIDGPNVARIGTTTTSSWIEVDVTSALRSGVPLSLAFVPRSADAFAFSSKEGGNKPSLVIEPADVADAGSAIDSGTASDASVPTDGSAPPPPSPVAAKYATAALKMADYLLEQQNTDGAIPDSPGGLVNEDSNMEYALIGLGAAYWYSRDARYLAGLEKGVRWLAAREEMADPTWKGSWMYTYQSTAPYAAVPTSPGSGISDVRGVDATSGLFVYLVYLHSMLSGTTTLATELQPNAKAAIDFLMAHNKSSLDPFFLSSWQKKSSGWVLWPFEYAADQGDVYLGLVGGSRLYEPAGGPMGTTADGIKNNIQLLFNSGAGRYALGRDEGATALDMSFDGFDGIFPQGYLPWMMGRNPNNLSAFNWLKSGVQTDGSLSLYSGDPKYTLSAAGLLMAAAGVGEPVPTTTADWLITVPFNATSGSVRDTATAGSDLITNVSGFSVVGLLGFKPL